jgi:tRNA dimethylallyltransferase
LDAAVSNLAIAVAGPTCSGKSALASALAERLGGTVINADAMQVYRDLRILTARPTPEEEARLPHALYGVRAASETSTVAWWRGAALAAMQEAAQQGSIPILCGGTGLYLASLTQGLAEIPDPGPRAREEARALLAALGPTGLHARLMEADPQTAARLRRGDSQRIARAWEVWSGTGMGLATWHDLQSGPADDFPWSLRAILLDPPRDTLRIAIEARFEAMIEHGALAEVRCRRCAPMGCRNLRPICAVRSACRKPAAAPARRRCSTRSVRAPGFATGTLLPRRQRIGSLRDSRIQGNLWKGFCQISLTLFMKLVDASQHGP